MWSLYEDEQLLQPLVFSNGKSQEDVVKEVLDAISEGQRIIFIKGMCGTGKSAIALNLARSIGKTSIVVPIKSLQEQYIKDYSGKIYVMDKNNEKKIKISSLIGRQNFKCTYIKEQELPKREFKEKNISLSEAFSDSPKLKVINDSCDNDLLPCKIEIKEKNASVIKNYIRQNPAVKVSDFSAINEVKRMTVAPVCPYWSPILPEEFDLHLPNAKRISYQGLNDQKFIIHQRKPGCSYYDQYTAYTDADVIIFNSLKYKIESLMNRKPYTELEIIDECDEFLDSFANQEAVNLNKLLVTLNVIFPEKSGHQKIIEELIDIVNTLKNKYADSSEITPIKGTLVEELIKSFIANTDFLKEIETDESSYLFHVESVSRMFAEYIDEAYFSVEKNNEEITLQIVTINLKKRFQELLEKNKIVVLMSGTLHSGEVLKNIFGLENYKVIDAETHQQGSLIKCKNGYEMDCKYSNFQSEKITREKYLKAFSKSIQCAKKPILVHVTSFSDLPTEYEKEMFDVDLPTQNELIQDQKNDPLGQRILEFKNKKTSILFTTKCNRGIDFPGDTCNSIIISRFPYPNISSLFWKILKRTAPEYFMDFYMDKAKRELLQRIYRGLRSKNDRVYLLSPDSRVLDVEI